MVVCACVVMACAGDAVARGQSLSTASRAGDLQVGGGYGVGLSDYEHYKMKGAMFYSSFDFRPHFGVEVDFHQMNNPSTKLYERTYEVGGRYLPREFGPLTPYAKLLYGRGVLNYPNNEANIAYNMFVGGGGLEYAVKPWLKVRADFEYQQWLSGFGLPRGLTPKIGTVGVAYRFGSGPPKGLQWAPVKGHAEARSAARKGAAPAAAPDAPATVQPEAAQPPSPPQR